MCGQCLVVCGMFLCHQFNEVTVEDTSSPTKCPITTRLALETDTETKEPILEVAKELICKLKPHQVDGAYWSACMLMLLYVCVGNLLQV